jgi:2-polyprenyl-3-methyl-5-hydroxy-6-metoxy-1,4-benzoquinol methylase
MNPEVRVGCANQDRWNRIGSSSSAEILSSPEKYVVESFPYPGPNHDMYDHLVTLLHPVEGKRIMEFGSGFGKVSVWLAKRGAQVTGVDLGPDLVEAARAIAKINQVDCKFLRGDVTKGPLTDPNTFDVVIGLAVLHHLSAEDLKRALQSASSLIKPGGLALFCEPVENSRIFAQVQNLLPVGKKGEIRPSILQRKAWKRYVASLDDRALSNRELMIAGKHYFRSMRISSFGFLIRLDGLLGSSYRDILLGADRVIFRALPPIKRYCQSVLVEYRK